MDNLDWEIYFDFEDYKLFKEKYPDFLEFFDHPEKNINEYLKMLAETNKPKIDWGTFEEYHHEVMSFIEMTQEQLRSLTEQKQSAIRETTPDHLREKSDAKKLMMGKARTTTVGDRLTKALAKGITKVGTMIHRGSISSKRR